MSLNTTPRTWVASEIVTAAMLNAEIRDALAGIQAAWTPYTPVIATGGTSITLGNGSIDAAYSQRGLSVDFRITFTVGSSTNLGSGTWAFGLPLTANAANQVSGSMSSLGPNRQGTWRNTVNSALPYENGTTTQAAVDTLGTVSGSVLILSGTYEAAA